MLCGLLSNKYENKEENECIKEDNTKINTESDQKGQNKKLVYNGKYKMNCINYGENKRNIPIVMILFGI